MNYRFTEQIPDSDALFVLYDAVDWNDFLGLSKEQITQATAQSWYALHVYDGEQLIGTGRVISDGVINGCLCGVAVHPNYQKQGIGSELIRRLVDQCRKHHLHIQLFCTEQNAAYYRKLGFEVFAVGMKQHA
ncbi:GNAT family N-acetyltransferase [Paenibacillus allorhizosphaerae]|uniref:N-acetyltransferase domain-containing protein n=1 Tax=Paenibacillus allorhizosphaerae TaxID=2849866 RepID=A0ABM8VEB6_9BACL|nr:GNAT family N-acetyltransferase [Paenibacillus allorhizosphaerae]CAG7630378.1 hypothetical protein PAECIP111802_01630 [Paenibacillus allorhizosphaerae]